MNLAILHQPPVPIVTASPYSCSTCAYFDGDVSCTHSTPPFSKAVIQHPTQLVCDHHLTDGELQRGRA